MLQSPEVQNRIKQLRLKEQAGTLTLEEAKEAIKAIREGRFSALTITPEKKSKSTKAAPRPVDDLLGELGL